MTIGWFGSCERDIYIPSVAGQIVKRKQCSYNLVNVLLGFYEQLPYKEWLLSYHRKKTKLNCFRFFKLFNEHNY